jgi:hypothetical protein
LPCSPAVFTEILRTGKWILKLLAEGGNISERVTSVIN